MKRAPSLLIGTGISAALIAAGIWFLSNHAQLFWYGHGRGWMPHGIMGGGMGVVRILFWIILVGALIALIAGITQRRSSDALTVLKNRYARGEIDKATFEAMRRDLQE